MDQFAQVVEAGVKAGADLVFLETMTDLYELKAALLAVREHSRLPVFASMSFESRGRTFTGCTVDSFAATAVGLGADAVASTARWARPRSCPLSGGCAGWCRRGCRCLSSPTPACPTRTAATI